jgi:hypothetical protein
LNREVKELLAERGIHFDHVTIYRWVQRFTSESIEAARPCCRMPGGRCFVDETQVKISGGRTYLYRAIDQHGQVVDVMLSKRCVLFNRRPAGRMSCPDGEWCRAGPPSTPATKSASTAKSPLDTSPSSSGAPPGADFGSE